MSTPTTGDIAKEPTSYPIKDFIDAKKLKEDLAYSPNNLSDAMITQASLFSHYGVLAADASRQVDIVKMLLENTEAAVYQILRDEISAAGEKVTEAMLEKKIARHPRVISMKKALNEAKRIESIGKTSVEAFRHRRDMLVQLGATGREEMKGELFIRERSTRDEANASTRDRILSRRSDNISTDEQN